MNPRFVSVVLLGCHTKQMCISVHKLPLPKIMLQTVAKFKNTVFLYDARYLPTIWSNLLPPCSKQKKRRWGKWYIILWRKGWDWGYVLADVDQWPEECYFLKGIKYISPEAHPASCTMGTGSFPGVRVRRGVTLTPHPFLVPRSKKE